MRLPTILATALVLALGLAFVWAPSPVMAGDGDRDLIDISKMKDKLKILSDGDGHFFALVHDSASKLLFYGSDGKSFYKQRVFSRYFDSKSKNYSGSFWSPRVNSDSRLHYKKKTGWVLQCAKRKTSLTELSADESKRVVDDGKFMDVFWKRVAYQLSRDDRGNYYYVDRYRDEHGGKGFRLFIGPKGNLTKTKLTNIVSDSEGDIFATKKGELRFISNKKSSTWVRGDKKVELTNVPVEKNVELIYGELGVYLESLGTPCDDL